MRGNVAGGTASLTCFVIWSQDKAETDATIFLQRGSYLLEVGRDSRV